MAKKTIEECALEVRKQYDALPARERGDGFLSGCFIVSAREHGFDPADRRRFVELCKKAKVAR